MPRAGQYVEVQYAVAQLIDAGVEMTTDEFVDAALQYEAIAKLEAEYGNIVDLSLVTSDPESLEKMEAELGEAVHGNPPREYGITESGLAGYSVHLTELVRHEAEFNS